jgi:hypothetical protein
MVIDCEVVVKLGVLVVSLEKTSEGCVVVVVKDIVPVDWDVVDGELLIVVDCVVVDDGSEVVTAVDDSPMEVVIEWLAAVVVEVVSVDWGVVGDEKLLVVPCVVVDAVDRDELVENSLGLMVDGCVVNVETGVVEVSLKLASEVCVVVEVMAFVPVGWDVVDGELLTVVDCVVANEGVVVGNVADDSPAEIVFGWIVFVVMEVVSVVWDEVDVDKLLVVPGVVVDVVTEETEVEDSLWLMVIDCEVVVDIGVFVVSVEKTSEGCVVVVVMDIVPVDW